VPWLRWLIVAYWLRMARALVAIAFPGGTGDAMDPWIVPGPAGLNG